MIVPRPVVAHGAALGDGFRVPAREINGARFPLCGGKQQLHRVDRLAHIAAADGCDVFRRARLQLRRYLLARGEDTNRAAHRFDGLLQGCRFGNSDRTGRKLIDPGQNRSCDQADACQREEHIG